MKSDIPIYIIDSSALITINRYYPLSHFPDLWVQLEDLFKQGRLLSHQMVYDEIVSNSKPKDEIGKLIVKYKSAFQPISNRQGQWAIKILATFPRLIDPNSKKDEADPWIIALAIEKMEEGNLFDSTPNFVVVSAESEKSETKIPAVCKHFKIRHLNLFQFFEDNDWKFSIKKKP